MPHATVVVNPGAGHAPLLRSLYPALDEQLRARGYTAGFVETTSLAGSATHLARAAALRHRAGDLVFACGGDGTVHGVVQGLAGTGVPLGVLPWGTHNALAGALGLPRNPVAALLEQLSWQPRLLPLGEIVSDSLPPVACKEPRFFLLMAGCGPAGALAHSMAAPSARKRLFGRAAYPLGAAALFLTRRWPVFRVDYRAPGASDWQRADAASLLVSRVPSLGGMFHRLTPRAALSDPHLHVHLLRAPAHLALPAWLARVPNPWLQTVDADEIRCTPLDTARPTLIQADAEPLGSLPCTMRVRPAALRLLLPAAS